MKQRIMFLDEVVIIGKPLDGIVGRFDAEQGLVRSKGLREIVSHGE